MSKKKDISIDSQIERLEQRNRDPKVKAERRQEQLKEYLSLLAKQRRLEEEQEELSEQLDKLNGQINGFELANDELFKCPSCGEKVTMESDEHDHVYITCDHCYLTTPHYPTAEEAYRCFLMFKDLFEGSKSDGQEQ